MRILHFTILLIDDYFDQSKMNRLVKLVSLISWSGWSGNDAKVWMANWSLGNLCLGCVVLWTVVWFGLIQSGLDWSGLVHSGPVWSGLVRSSAVCKDSQDELVYLYIYRVWWILWWFIWHNAYKQLNIIHWRNMITPQQVWWKPASPIFNKLKKTRLTYNCAHLRTKESLRFEYDIW